MPDNARQKREQLFDLYSRQMALYDPEPGDAFVCPLCRRVYPREALTTDPPLLTLAHIVPQSLGGTTSTLACAPCNNDSGSGHEKVLLDHLHQKDWEAGMGIIRGRLETDCGDVAIEMQRGPDQSWRFNVIPLRSNPAHVEALQQRMAGLVNDPLPGFEFTLRWRAWNAPRRVYAALYQAAYLLLFSHFGYEAVAHPHFDHLREWLRQPEDGDWAPRVMDIPEESCTRVLGTGQHALLLHHEPPAMMAVLRCRPRGGLARVFGVVLPGLDSPGVPEVKPGPFRFTYIPYKPDALIQVRGYMRAVWDYFQRG
jgi:hypothetical protein